MTVIRLNNGGSIQVRTGVLQGIGPIGPQGVQGTQGIQGETGPEGPTGPMGQIQQFLTKANVGSAISMAKDVDTLVSFSAVINDDLDAVDSTTNFTIQATALYLITAWVKFEMPANPGDGVRSVWITSASRGTLARDSILSVVDEPTYVQVSWPDYYSAGETINIVARQGDDLSVALSTGAIAITRLGSGPKGDPGPVGAVGPVGPAGAQGLQGIPGNASSGYATYADLR